MFPSHPCCEQTLVCPALVLKGLSLPCAQKMRSSLLPLVSLTHSLLSASSPITIALIFLPPTHPQHHHQVPWPRFPPVHVGQHPEGPPALLCPHVLPQGCCTCCPQPASALRAPQNSLQSLPRRHLPREAFTAQCLPECPHSPFTLHLEQELCFGHTST